VRVLGPHARRPRSCHSNAPVVRRSGAADPRAESQALRRPPPIL
jgi:hypothetical protein